MNAVLRALLDTIVALPGTLDRIDTRLRDILDTFNRYDQTLERFFGWLDRPESTFPLCATSRLVTDVSPLGTGSVRRKPNRLDAASNAATGRLLDRCRRTRLDSRRSRRQHESRGIYRL